MKGTINILQYSGIPVRLHWSFGLIFLWVFYVGQHWNMGIEGMLWIGSLVIALFLCVILHEFGHALTAKHFGVKTKDIILSPIGGVARLESLPQKPIQEFYIAAAGPLVNLGIAVALYPIILIVSPSHWTLSTLLKLGPEANPALIFIPSLIVLNLGLALFNLVPAFPLDGGRIFRALLSIRMGKFRATKTATIVGQGFAILLALVGLYLGNFFTIAISLFLYFSARQEMQYVQVQKILTSFTVKDIYRSHFKKIYAQDPMQLAITESQKGVERSFLVFNLADEIIGVLHEEFVLEAIKEKAPERLTIDYLSPKFEYIDPADSLKTILEKMQKEGYSILPIRSEGKLLGVLDRNGLYNFIELQRKIR